MFESIFKTFPINILEEQKFSCYRLVVLLKYWRNAQLQTFFFSSLPLLSIQALLTFDQAGAAVLLVQGPTLLPQPPKHTGVEVHATVLNTRVTLKTHLKPTYDANLSLVTFKSINCSVDRPGVDVAQN